MLIEPVSASDRAVLLDLAIRTKLFAPAEAESLLGDVLDGFAASRMPPCHEAVCCRPASGAAPIGWCYFAPDDHAAGVWNLWWIGVSPHHHGSGAGRRLLAHVEGTVVSQGGRLLIVETSDSDKLARARRFYAAGGYVECGRVPHFYAPHESKVIFARHLRSAS